MKIRHRQLPVFSIHLLAFGLNRLLLVRSEPDSVTAIDFSSGARHSHLHTRNSQSSQKGIKGFGSASHLKVHGHDVTSQPENPSVVSPPGIQHLSLTETNETSTNSTNGCIPGFNAASSLFGLELAALGPGLLAIDWLKDFPKPLLDVTYLD